VSDRAVVTLRSQADRDKASRWAQGVTIGSKVVYHGPGRTIPQNDALHGLINQIIKQRPTLHGNPMDMGLWKATFMNALGIEIRLMPTLDGKGVFPIGLSTRDLSKEQFSDLIEYILWWCATEDLTIEHFDNPPPDAA